MASRLSTGPRRCLGRTQATRGTWCGLSSDEPGPPLRAGHLLGQGEVLGEPQAGCWHGCPTPDSPASGLQPPARGKEKLGQLFSCTSGVEELLPGGGAQWASLCGGQSSAPGSRLLTPIRSTPPSGSWRGPAGLLPHEGLVFSVSFLHCRHGPSLFLVL